MSGTIRGAARLWPAWPGPRPERSPRRARPTGGRAEVVVAITRDAAESLGLAVGDEVHAVIKSTEVMVGKE